MQGMPAEQPDWFFGEFLGTIEEVSFADEPRFIDNELRICSLHFRFSNGEKRTTEMILFSDQIVVTVYKGHEHKTITDNPNEDQMRDDTKWLMSVVNHVLGQENLKN